METTYLSAVCIGRKYGIASVLREISFNLGPGEVLGLLGPNGSGKSTLLNILALADRPSEGGLLINGTDAMHKAVKLRRKIGYVPQEIALFEELTVKDNLLCWSRRPGREARCKALEIAERLQLTSLLNKKVDTLSGGMKRRVNLAVALISDPDLLVLDEPFAGVDAEQIEGMVELLAQLKREGVTQILSCHGPDQIVPLVSRVMVLSAGNMKFFGDTEAFLLHAEDNNAGSALKNILRG